MSIVSDSTPIDDDVRVMQPLITARGALNRKRLLQHPNAPQWNHVAGDRVDAAARQAAMALRETLQSERPAARALPPAVAAWIEARRGRVPLFRERVPRGFDVSAHFHEVETSHREDLATRPEALIADDADLESMICYRTAGTTGHPLLVPHHPSATAAYPIFIEHALSVYGVSLDARDDNVTCLLIGAQKHTVTYPCVLSVWGQTGFAKINLDAGQWSTVRDRTAFLLDCDAQLFTGDPLSFAELMRQSIEEGFTLRPRALVSTAVAMSEGLKTALQSHFDCPVIDWYSLTETGPIGFWDPVRAGYRVLPHDVYVEALDADGDPVAEGERGEITVTGGRNPFIPLLRYRTGDWGRIRHLVDDDGVVRTYLFDLEGRAPVLFRSASGAAVNPVDISKVLRRFALVQHEMEQRADRSVQLTLRMISPGAAQDDEIRAALEGLLGRVNIDIVHDASLGERKVVPYRSALLLE